MVNALLVNIKKKASLYEILETLGLINQMCMKFYYEIFAQNHLL